MKRILLIFSLVLLSLPAFPQIKLGVQITPGLSFNRVRDESVSKDFTASGVGGRFIAGITADYPFRENYYVSSGLFFVPKRVGIRGSGLDQITEIQRLHYLQVPATLKLFTNEVALDTRIYFQVGLTLDVKLLEDNISDQIKYVADFRSVDSSLLTAAGAEYRLGYNTILYGGLSYRRGLANVVKNPLDRDASGLIIKNDILGIDLGIKF